jgi:hypothetical protein
LIAIQIGKTKDSRVNQWPLERLERCEGKPSRTVLRGLGLATVPGYPTWHLILAHSHLILAGKNRHYHLILAEIMGLFLARAITIAGHYT